MAELIFRTCLKCGASFKALSNSPMFACGNCRGVMPTEPTPASERRCGGCVHFKVCCKHIGAYPVALENEKATGCPHYSDGALPEGIAQIVRKLDKWWYKPSPSQNARSDRYVELMRLAHELSAAELAMAGVKGGERG